MKSLKLNKTTRWNYLTYLLVILAYVILQVLGSAGAISSSLKGMLVPICAYIVMAISLNLTVGVLGELSLGHAGFMSMGAFTGVTRTPSPPRRCAWPSPWPWAPPLPPWPVSSSASRCCG